MVEVNAVAVHPTSLLSVVDHYTRVAKGSSKRVIGTLLGETKKDGLHVTSSFAVPFEEDAKDPRIWFVDHDYHQMMFDMFKKVNPKERVVGWYSTGPSIRPCDLEIHEVYRRYCSDQNPVFVIIDVVGKEELGLPIKSYISSEETSINAGDSQRTFLHIPSFVSSLEAEEVGVEHLLRDIKNATASTLAVQVTDRMKALKTLSAELLDVRAYMDDVIAGKLPHNQDILDNIQMIVNSLGGSGERLAQDPALRAAFNVERNDAALAIYLGGALRSTLAMHDLIDNKLKNKHLAAKPADEKITPVEVTLTNKDNTVEASGA